MEYAAMTFWLLVIVFTALGVHQLWSSLIHPRVVNSILLPGTLVAQLGYVLGLLVTGGTVNNTSLITDDESGEPQTDTDTQTRVPVIGTIIIALLPMIGCAVAIYWVSRYLGSEILTGMSAESVQRFALPTSLPLFFAILHGTLELVQQLVAVIRSANLTDWRTLLFLYLAICLTVRMAPLTGNVRGALGAIFLTGVLAFLVGQLAGSASGALASAWPLISFTVAVLLALLIISLVVKGSVALFKTCMGER
jgi:hypothetical protein